MVFSLLLHKIFTKKPSVYIEDGTQIHSMTRPVGWCSLHSRINQNLSIWTCSSHDSTINGTFTFAISSLQMDTPLSRGYSITSSRYHFRVLWWNRRIASYVQRTATYGRVRNPYSVVISEADSEIDEYYLLITYIWQHHINVMLLTCLRSRQDEFKRVTGQRLTKLWSIDRGKDICPLITSSCQAQLRSSQHRT